MTKVGSGDGSRAGSAFIRPYPLRASGAIKLSMFSLEAVAYDLSIDGSVEDAVTEIFLPHIHFPRDAMRVQTRPESKWEMEQGSEILKWYHGKGCHTVRVYGVKMSQESTENNCICM